MQIALNVAPPPLQPAPNAAALLPQLPIGIRPLNLNAVPWQQPLVSHQQNDAHPRAVQLAQGMHPVHGHQQQNDAHPGAAQFAQGVHPVHSHQQHGQPVPSQQQAQGQMGPGPQYFNVPPLPLQQIAQPNAQQQMLAPPQTAPQFQQQQLQAALLHRLAHMQQVPDNMQIVTAQQHWAPGVFGQGPFSQQAFFGPALGQPVMQAPAYQQGFAQFRQGWPHMPLNAQQAAGNQQIPIQQPAAQVPPPLQNNAQEAASQQAAVAAAVPVQAPPAVPPRPAANRAGPCRSPELSEVSDESRDSRDSSDQENDDPLPVEREEGELVPMPFIPGQREKRPEWFRRIRVPPANQIEWSRTRNKIMYKMCAEVTRNLQDFRHRHCPSATASAAAVASYNKVLKSAEHSLDLVKLADTSPYDWEAISKATAVLPTENAKLAKRAKKADAEIKEQRKLEQQRCEWVSQSAGRAASCVEMLPFEPSAFCPVSGATTSGPFRRAAAVGEPPITTSPRTRIRLTAVGGAEERAARLQAVSTGRRHGRESATGASSRATMPRIVQRVTTGPAERPVQTQKCKCRVHMYSDGSCLASSSALFKWIDSNWDSLEKVEVKGNWPDIYQRGKLLRQTSLFCQ